MNNTTKRNLALAAVFMAATLVVGTFAVTTTQSAFAYKKDSGNGNTVTIEECKNRGSASGFDTTLDQECENLICTHPGENATCTQEGVVSAAAQTPVTPVKLTCEQCYTKFLSTAQITMLLSDTAVNNLEELCTLPIRLTEAGFVDFLVNSLKLSESAAAQLTQCLIDAGVQFSTDTGTIRTR